MDSQTLNRWAIAEIEKYGLTRFSEMLGLSHSSVRSWKTAKIRYLKDSTIEKIAVYMSSSPDEVREYFGISKPDPVEQLRSEVEYLRSQLQELKQLVKTA